MVGLILFALILVMGILAGRLGVDSRDGSTDPRRSPYPVGMN